ncbi:hypothetical protein A2U01_0020291, partial [Trifolium medium]|nr:hypothetical protein [Trifolium medium]
MFLFVQLSIRFNCLLAAEQKSQKPQKKAKKTKVGPTVSGVLEHTASGIGSPSSPVMSSTETKGARQKRPTEENLATIVDLSEGERGFMLPACFEQKSFLDQHPPMVPASEKKYILEMSSEARRAQLSQDIVVVIRLTETSLVLDEGQMEEARATANKLKDTEKELGDLKVSNAEEKEKLEDEIATLKAMMAPVVGKTKSTRELATRAELVREVKRLEKQMVA